MDLQQFLVWLTTSAGYSGALSFITERIPAFQSLNANQKALVHLGGSLAIALGAYAVLTYVPPPTLEAVKPIFLLISGVLGTWIANQAAHKIDPAA